MSKMPKVAYKARDYVMANVKRPTALPRLVEYDQTTNFGLRWDGGQHGVDPLGLCPESPRYLPVEAFDTLSNDDVTDFISWWDSQTDPQDAVDQVWGKE